MDLFIEGLFELCLFIILSIGWKLVINKVFSGKVLLKSCSIKRIKLERFFEFFCDKMIILVVLEMDRY